MQITYIPRYQFGIVYVRGITMFVMIRRLWNYLRNNGNTELGKNAGVLRKHMESKLHAIREITKLTSYYVHI